MKNRNLFCFFVGLAFTCHVLPARSNNIVTAKFDKRKTEIGGLIKLSIRVSGTLTGAVNWDLCDSLFAANKQIKLMGVKQTAGNTPRIFERTIIFTAIKPGNVTIGPLPVIINGLNTSDTLVTGTYAISFTKAALPASINDIKPISKIEVGVSKTMLITAAVLIAVVISWWAALLFFKRMKARSGGKTMVGQICLQKLQVIEDELRESNLSAGNLAERIFEVFKQYLSNSVLYAPLIVNGCDESVLQQISLHNSNNTETDSLVTILKTTENLRFSLNNNSRELLNQYLTDVKQFITNHPLPV